MTEIIKRKRGRPPKPKVPIIPAPPKEDSMSKFEKFLNIIRGKSDVKSRIRLLLDPDKVETSTYLTKAEVDFVSTALYVAQEFPMFETLADYAIEYSLVKISEQGHGVESVIRFTSAINESKLLSKFSLGLTRGEEQVKGKEEKT
jgi:hypothetical protein